MPTSIQSYQNLIQSMMLSGQIRSPQEARQYLQSQYGLSPTDIQQVMAPMEGLEQDIFGEQGLRDVFLRGTQNALGQGVGNFNPIGQRALQSGFSRFQDVAPLTNFFDNQELGQAFGGYLSGQRPTAQGLSSTLNNILDSVRGNLDAGSNPNAALFQARFGDPNSALSGAMQPFLQSVAPRLRNSVGNVLGDRFGTQFATNPLNYQSPDQLFNFMDTFNQNFNRGF